MGDTTATWVMSYGMLENAVMQIETARYPQLRFLCWSCPGVRHLDGPAALALYERCWRHVDQDRLTEDEKALIDDLVQRYGDGVLNV